MDRLIEGHRRFRAETWPAEKARYETLAKGQSPETLVVSCVDSRVDPQTVFGAAPGELLVVRNVAALVPPHKIDAGYHGTSAALEFGVRVLKVRRIVVLGHSQCGGVQAMLKGVPSATPDFLGQWVALGEPAVSDLDRDVDDAELAKNGEAGVVGLSLKNLMTFPWIAEAVNAGRLDVHGFRFSIASGTLEALDGDRLVPVT